MKATLLEFSRGASERAFFPEGADGLAGPDRTPAWPEGDPVQGLLLESVQRIVDAYVPPPRLDDSLISSEAELYRMSQVHRVVPFVAWLVIRGYGGFERAKL